MSSNEFLKILQTLGFALNTCRGNTMTNLHIYAVRSEHSLVVLDISEVWLSLQKKEEPRKTAIRCRLIWVFAEHNIIGHIFCMKRPTLRNKKQLLISESSLKWSYFYRKAVATNATESKNFKGKAISMEIIYQINGFKIFKDY